MAGENLHYFIDSASKLGLTFTEAELRESHSPFVLEELRKLGITVSDAPSVALPKPTVPAVADDIQAGNLLAVFREAISGFCFDGIETDKKTTIQTYIRNTCQLLKKIPEEGLAVADVKTHLLALPEGAPSLVGVHAQIVSFLNPETAPTHTGVSAPFGSVATETAGTGAASGSSAGSSSKCCIQ